MDAMMEATAPPVAIPNSCENNGKYVTVSVDEDPSSNESGIDETEFNTTREESEKLFARQFADGRPSFSFQDLLESLEIKKIARKDSISEVEIDPVSNLLHLKVDRSGLKMRFGYDVGKDTYLYPEEAIFLLDSRKIEVFSQHLNISMERALARLLISHRPINTDKISHITTEEYRVYKDLTQKGYCLYRYRRDIAAQVKSACSPDLETNDDDQDVLMDEDVILEENCGRVEDADDVIEIEPSNDYQNQLKRGVKRKHTSSLSEDEMLDEPEEMMEDSNEQYPFQNDSTGVSYFVNTTGDTFTASSVEPGGYTVDEADSDIEIVDEVIFRHGGVEIQEIGHCSGYQEEEFIDDSEPVPSTSKGPPPPSQVVVDLVSSDDEEEDLRSFRSKIWSKFVPNSKLYMKVPPSSLIPENIPVTEKVYEYDLKDKSDTSDLELEFLVDEVSLNDDNTQQPSLSTADNWKEWRANMFREARDVMNDSLLASSDFISGASATEKLFLWDDKHLESKKSVPFTNEIVFEAYGPAEQGYSRTQAMEGKPTFYISILRDKETIPDLRSFASSIDGVPIINAIVCDSDDVVYIKADTSPLQSLFDT